MCKREFVGTMVVCTHDGTLLMQVKQDQVIGSLLQDKYHVMSEIGRGGMSIVYKARQEMMDRQVAVKMLQQGLMNDQTSIKRFQQEVQAASCLQHQNVITIFDFGVSATGQPYLVMDFLEGQSLSDVIKAENHITARRAAGIFVQACDALEHAHQKGVLHRDLKSSNVMLIEYDGSPDFVKVVDFGIAKLMPNSGQQQQNLTQTGEIFGSPIYMSPEQCLGMPLDARSDIYSMGTMLYEALTGQPPLLGANIIDTMQMHVETAPQTPSKIRSDLQIPKPIEMICLRALEKKAENRFRSMGEFRDALLAIVPLLPVVGASDRTRAGARTGTRQNLPSAGRQGITGTTSQSATGAPSGNWNYPTGPSAGVGGAQGQPGLQNLGGTGAPNQTQAPQRDRFAPPVPMDPAPAQPVQGLPQGQPPQGFATGAHGQPQQYQQQQNFQQGQMPPQGYAQQRQQNQPYPAGQQYPQQQAPGQPQQYSTDSAPQQYATGAQAQQQQQYATGAPAPYQPQNPPGAQVPLAQQNAQQHAIPPLPQPQMPGQGPPSQQYATGTNQPQQQWTQQLPQGQNPQQYATGAQGQNLPQNQQLSQQPQQYATGAQTQMGAQGQVPGQGQVQGQGQPLAPNVPGVQNQYATGAPGMISQTQQSASGPQHLMARTGDYQSPTAEQQAEYAKYANQDPNDDSLFGNPSLYGEPTLFDGTAKSRQAEKLSAAASTPRHVPDHLPSKRINSDYSDLLNAPAVDKKAQAGAKPKLQIHAPELPKDRKQLIIMIVLFSGATILVIVAACMAFLNNVKIPH